MPSAATFAVFGLASLALLLVPGPAVVYIVTRSASQGRRVGVFAVLGVHVGTLFHVMAATVGLSAVLASSAAAFSVVKYAGAAYLIALGLRRLLAPRDTGLVTEPSRRRRGASPTGGAFLEGIVVNVLNPKTALFFLAFLPQFLDRGRGLVPLQALLLGLTFVALGLVTDTAYSLLAATLAGRLASSPRAARRSERVSGLVYLGLGAVAAATPRHITRAT